MSPVRGVAEPRLPGGRQGREGDAVGVQGTEHVGVGTAYDPGGRHGHRGIGWAVGGERVEQKPEALKHHAHQRGHGQGPESAGGR